MLVLCRVSQQDHAMSYLTVPALVGPVAGPLLAALSPTISTGVGFSGSTCRSAPSALPLPQFPSRMSWRRHRATRRNGLSPMWLWISISPLRSRRCRAPDFIQGQAAIFLAGAGAAALSAYVLRAGHAAFPLLDLKLLSIETFRASVIGGSLFRIGINRSLSLFPLMLQAGFGMNALQSGSITFVASAGAMAMKATAAPILRVFGFRRVLVFAAILSAGFLGCYGFFTATTPVVLMMGLLFAGGLCGRSNSPASTPSAQAISPAGQ